jgi:hypothetical protein
MGSRSMIGRLAVLLSCASFVGCATARPVLHDAGILLAGLGVLTVAVALRPECDDEGEWESCDEGGYSEESLQTRGALIAGGGAAMLLGGGITAVASPPKPKRKRVQVAAVGPAENARPPETETTRLLRRMIEKRCAPETQALDLRVPAKPDEPSPPLPSCTGHRGRTEKPK